MKRTITASFIILLITAGLVCQSPAAEDTGKKEEKYMTRAEAARLLSATDFLKKKIGALLSWSIGYDISAVNRAKLVPSIRYVQAQPIKVPPDGRTVFSLMVSVDDPGGLGNISGVRADLSNIGHLPNTALVDNGLWGDTKAGDGIFTIQTSVSPDVAYGKKDIAIAVANKKGWLALSRTSLDVEKNPSIIWTRAVPESVKSDGGSKVLLEAAVENPGRPEDLESVKIDLTPIGIKGERSMRDDGGGGDRKSGDKVFSLEVTVPGGVDPGDKTLQIRAKNVISGSGVGVIKLTVTR